MKTLLLGGVLVLVSGCSLVRHAPSEAKARSLESGRNTAEREAQVRAEAGALERQGLTGPEARALAEAQRPAARP